SPTGFVALTEPGGGRWWWAAGWAATPNSSPGCGSPRPRSTWRRRRSTPRGSGTPAHRCAIYKPTYSTRPPRGRPPSAPWPPACDLLLESLTVKSLRIAMHPAAIAAVPRFVAPGGTLLVVAAGRDDSVPPGDGPPWPLLRSEIDAFAGDGVEPVRVEAISD